MDQKYGLIARMMLRRFKPGYMGISKLLPSPLNWFYE
jgi:hypothetical protein